MFIDLYGRRDGVHVDQWLGGFRRMVGVVQAIGLGVSMCLFGGRWGVSLHGAQVDNPLRGGFSC